MGVTPTPKPFERVLASLMTEREAVGALLARAGIAPDAVSADRLADDAAALLAPSSMSYFEERLQIVGRDSAFSVDVPVEPGTRRHRFALSVWPDFELGVLMGPDGVPFYPHFVRKPGVEPRLPADVRDVRPWSATLEEIHARFGSPAADSAWDLRRWVTYDTGAGKYTLTFDIGLVQHVHLEQDASEERPGHAAADLA